MSAFDHEFGPTTFSSDTFKPFKKCRKCGVKFDCDDIARGIPACSGAQNRGRGLPPLIATSDGKAVIQPPAPDRCECGSFKVSGAGKGQPGHSDWCPWAP